MIIRVVIKKINLTQMERLTDAERTCPTCPEDFTDDYAEHRRSAT